MSSALVQLEVSHVVSDTVKKLQIPSSSLSCYVTGAECSRGLDCSLWVGASGKIPIGRVLLFLSRGNSTQTARLRTLSDSFFTAQLC